MTTDDLDDIDDAPTHVFDGIRFPKEHDLGATLTDRDYLRAIGSYPEATPKTPSHHHEVPSPRSSSTLTFRHLLGEGGMGRVFLANQNSLQREVAVKVLREGPLDAEHAAMLLAEARTMGMIEHPNVVPVHLLDKDEHGRPVLVMKRVEGVQWSALMRDPYHPLWNQLPLFRGDVLEAHLAILMHVCNAVQFAHSRGLLHRDIKPDNVMVGAFGEVYLMDWGLATPLGSQEIVRSSSNWRGPVGTPVYMAPEMAMGDVLDERADVFLLGAVLHEVLTGNPRHEGTQLMAVLVNALNPKPIAYPPTVPADLAALANSATALDRNARPPTVQAFRSTIADHLSHRGSVQLSRAAHVLLHELEASVSAPSSDAVAFERKAAECRFGFTQALREWPENRDASRGLQTLLVHMAQRALDRDDVEAAVALVAEMPRYDAALSNRVKAARESVLQRRDEQARAQQLAKEMDLTVGLRQRRRFFGALSAGGVLWNVGYYLARWRGFRVFTPKSILLYAVVLCVLVAGVTIYAWRAMFHNVINRRVAVVPMVGVGLVLVHRIIGYFGDASVESVVSNDLYMLAVLTTTAAVLIQPSYLFTSGLFFAGALISTIKPSWAQPCFTTFGALGLLTLYLAWSRPARSNEGPAHKREPSL